MAFTATVLQDALLNVRETNGLGFQENERRRTRYGALEAARIGTPLLVPATTLREIKEATSQTTQIEVFNKEAAGTGTARKCNGVGTGTTARQAITYSTFVEEFAISFLEHDANEAKMQDAFNHMFNEKLRNLTTRVNIAAVAALEAAAVPGAGSFGVIAANARQFSAADRLDYFNQVKANMNENDFFGGIHNIASFSQGELIRFDESQTQDTGTNRAFQLTDYTHFPSAGVANIPLVESTSYMFQPGTFGMISWTNQLSRMGKVVGGDRWETFEDPFGLLGQIELKVKEDCVDNSVALGAGSEADLQTGYVMTVEVAFPTAYDSTGTDSGIYKAEVLA